MTQSWQWMPKPHECAVILGIDAVEAYNNGETSIAKLETLGRVEFFTFQNLAEFCAFYKGIEVAQGALDALAVDDLTA